MIDPAIRAHLSKEPTIAPIVAAHEIPPRPDHGGDVYFGLLRSIAYQQLSGKAAGTIFGRFLQLFPDEYPHPERLLEMDDDAAANKYLHLGAAKGNFYCQREYARNLLQGRGTEKDFDRAIALLDAAADGGDAEAKLLLADCYSGMYPSIPRDTQQMVDYLWSAASDGVPEAQSKMGYCYEKGIGVAADQETAFKWYGQAAEKNYPQAMVNLGHCYQAGVGTAKDEKKAFEWYKKAAEMDFAVGLFNLGIFYMAGGPVARNERIAFSYFERAAKLGFVQAQYNLAVAYEEGKGADINRPMAFFWYKQAARQEYPAAITGLGYCYYRGYPGSHDFG